MTPEDERHGTNAGYAAGCRDQCCRDAMSARRRANRKRAYLLRGSAMLSALGSQRRIHALQALGWRQIDIAEAGGWAATEDVDSIMNRKHVIITTAQRVDEVYSKLCMTLGPSNRTRMYAARQGWLPPLAWDEDTIDSPSAEAHLMAKMNTLLKTDSLEDRLWSRVDVTPTCWLWTGGLDGKGYGVKVKENGREQRPHRWAYELIKGKIPDGLVLDHLCRVRHCCNPDHLEPVTAEENTQRGVDARWIEDCPNGHAAAAFRRTLPSGKNICVACRRESDQKRPQEDKERRRVANRERHHRIDELIVDVICEGSRVTSRLNVPTRRAIVVRLRARGQSSGEIALRCGVSVDVVEMDIRRTA